MPPDFLHIRNWIFDLDNTLYSPHLPVFPQIHVRMDQYIMQHFGISAEEAALRRRNYFYAYGTSLRGLMVEEKIDPDHFLDFCHDVDLGPVEARADLRALLEKLDGRKLVFTNADCRHAARILDRLGIAACFEGIFDIADGAYICKPSQEPYEALLAKYAMDARESCMFEDMEANLEAAHALGMTTVWLRHEADWLRHKPLPAGSHTHCHHTADDLIPFLEKIVEGRS